MPTIAGTLRASARRVPGEQALVFADRAYSYAELDAEVDRVAAALTALGLSKGDRLALMAANSDRFVVVFYASLRLGAIFVPVNPALAPPEVEYLLTDSNVRIFVFDPALAATVQGTAIPPTVRKVLSLGTSGGHDAGYDDLAELVTGVTGSTGSSPRLRDEDVVESDDALILYTSGTTGAPKGALFDHRRTMWAAVNFVAVCGMRAGDRFLHVAPLYHAAELCIMLIPGTMIGARHVVLPGFEPTSVLDALESQRITMFFGVPTMYQFLLRHPELPHRDLSAWRTGLFGAAPMPPDAVEQLVGALPGVQIMQLCGQTEAGPGGIYSTAEQVRQRPDASGRQPLLFTEARVVDPTDRDVQPGEIGELILRGETIMKGYWNNPDESRQALRGGWLRTGDLARVDADGYITLVDRLKDMIITGGRNVYSIEVELVLSAHPDVVDCAVIARPHADYGESIVAVVTPRQGSTITLEDIRGFCRGRIADYKIPHYLTTREIPRNASGKVLKNQLRADLARNVDTSHRIIG
jgi:fatty-acyl-CoA synthase